MITISNSHNCCGCGACQQRCPRQCITLQSDDEGFLYPHVDADSCIDCGLCEKTCPVLHPSEKREPAQTLAAINPNEEIRMQSSSGGIFSLLAEKIIDEGGVVFGARFDEEWQVTLDYTESKERLAAFRGSKYVQARTADTYSQCEQFLKDGRKVMYSGTPCQIAGLWHFLHKEYENLLLVDFVCHGVPSPKVWKRYLNEITQGATTNVAMRGKRDGWKNFNFSLSYNEGEKFYNFSSPFNKNDYMNAFLRDMILRPSCYQCKSKEGRSHSDITIADYWGIYNIHPEMDDDKGTSLVMIHTEKGLVALPKKDLRYVDSTYKEGCRYNPAIVRSPTPWPKRERFFSQLDESESVISLIRESLRPSKIMLLKRRIAFCIRLPKRVLHHLLH